jgi:hypothetical protein
MNTIMMTMTALILAVGLAGCGATKGGLGTSLGAVNTPSPAQECCPDCPDCPECCVVVVCCSDAEECCLDCDDCDGCPLCCPGGVCCAASDG